MKHSHFKPPTEAEIYEFAKIRFDTVRESPKKHRGEIWEQATAILNNPIPIFARLVIESPWPVGELYRQIYGTSYPELEE